VALERENIFRTVLFLDFSLTCILCTFQFLILLSGKEVLTIMSGSPFAQKAWFQQDGSENLS